MRNKSGFGIIFGGVILSSVLLILTGFIVGSGRYYDRPFLWGLLIAVLTAVVLAGWFILGVLWIRSNQNAGKAETRGNSNYLTAKLAALGIFSVMIVASPGAGIFAGAYGAPLLGLNPFERGTAETGTLELDEELQGLIEAAVEAVEIRCQTVARSRPIDITRATLDQVFPGSTLEYLDSRFEHVNYLAFLDDESLLVTESFRGEPFFTRFLASKQSEKGPAYFELVGSLQGEAVIDLLVIKDRRELFWSYLAEDESGFYIGVARAAIEGGVPGFSTARTLFETSPRVSDPGNFIQHGGRLTYEPAIGLIFSIGEFTLAPSRLEEQAQMFDTQPFIDSQFGYGATYLIDLETLEVEKFTSGHRNPQGLVVEPATGTIWMNEHGPGGGDEINVLIEGNDYGWWQDTLGRPYDGFDRLLSDSDFQRQYLETVGLDGLNRWCSEGAQGSSGPYALLSADSVAPSQMVIVPAAVETDASESSGSKLIMGTLSNRALWIADIDGETLTNWKRVPIGERVRDIAVAENGDVYIAIDGGRLMRINR